jgi:hypothetical protein
MNVTQEGADALVLRFSHNIIEHLGLKLYQNRPTNVGAELVSNAWDAGAHRVWIDTHTIRLAGDSRFISVAVTWKDRSDVAHSIMRRSSFPNREDRAAHP